MPSKPCSSRLSKETNTRREIKARRPCISRSQHCSKRHQNFQVSQKYCLGNVPHFQAAGLGGDTVLSSQDPVCLRKDTCQECGEGECLFVPHASPLSFIRKPAIYSLSCQGIACNERTLCGGGGGEGECSVVMPPYKLKKLPPVVMCISVIYCCTFKRGVRHAMM